MWSIQKPNKDGLWLWRLPDKKHHGTGVIRVSGTNKVEELITPPTTRVYDLDVWWGMGEVETFFVDGA